MCISWTIKNPNNSSVYHDVVKRFISNDVYGWEERELEDTVRNI
jgi:hypothetical protein